MPASLPSRTAGCLCGSTGPAGDTAAHSPDKRPFVQPRSAATREGCGGTLATTLAASPRLRRVRHVCASPVPRHTQGLRQWSASTEACLACPMACAGGQPAVPSCWCAPRGRALTQEPSGITVRTLARREERPQRTRGRSGTAADLQERSDWQSPRAGVRGREASMARAERSGAGAFLGSPSGGDEVRQGAASVRARCRADGGPEQCLAAQCEAGAVRR